MAWYCQPTSHYLSQCGPNVWYHIGSGVEKRRTCRTYPMARPKCLMVNFTNSYRICKGHQTNVWWAMKVFRLHCIGRHELTHWGRVTHICVSNLPTIGSDNGLSPGRRQAIIWTNAGILLIGPLWTNFSEILIEIPTFSFKKMRLEVQSAKWRPCSLGLNVLTH